MMKEKSYCSPLESYLFLFDKSGDFFSLKGKEVIINYLISLNQSFQKNLLFNSKINVLFNTEIPKLWIIYQS